MVVILIVFIGFDILINKDFLHSLDFARAIQVLMVFVLLAQFVRVEHWTGMIFCEMILLVKFELILADILIELIKQNELMVLL